MAMIPQIKKDLKKFLLSEDGKISKQTLVGVGSAVLTSIACSKTVFAQHSSDYPHQNAIGLTPGASDETGTAVGVHNHHASHVSHSSHSSHSSGGGGKMKIF